MGDADFSEIESVSFFCFQREIDFFIYTAKCFSSLKKNPLPSSLDKKMYFFPMFDQVELIH